MVVVPDPVDMWTWAPPTDRPFLRAVTTNGCVKDDGQLVMGKGTALQASLRYPELALKLGSLVKSSGNVVHVLEDYQIVSFPVKHDWRDRADLKLIIRSAEQLKSVLSHPECLWGAVVLPQPGCGFGWLSWENVRPALELVLDGSPVYVVGGKS